MFASACLVDSIICWPSLLINFKTVTAYALFTSFYITFACRCFVKDLVLIKIIYNE